jgi:hypothetical protein
MHGGDEKCATDDEQNFVRQLRYKSLLDHTVDQF